MEEMRLSAHTMLGELYYFLLDINQHNLSEIYETCAVRISYSVTIF